MPPGARRALYRWYEINGRHELRWRQTRDPYAVLVSEVMLQQTQVSRVSPHFERWMARWPTVEALAASRPAEVIREWAGLGYNRRALHLWNAARVVAANGRFPRSVQQLAYLPGVGEYTASAVACFAFGRHVSVADTNVARVLVRSLGGCATASEVPSDDRRSLVACSLPRREAQRWNLALMDLGAMVCTERAPKCGACPLASWCEWRRRGYPPTTAARPTGAGFESTSRFARGRLLAALRDAPAGLTLAQARARLPADHRPHTQTYLRALERDGLAAFGASRWSLPS